MHRLFLKLPWLLWFSCLLLSPAWGIKTVQVSVKTGWKETSLFAEASEFFAAQESSLFWVFVDNVTRSLNEGHTDLRSDVPWGSPLAMYRHIMAFSEKVLSPHSLSSLKYALGIRYYSPKVELHHQFTRRYASQQPSIIRSACYAVVEGASNAFLSLSELEGHLTSTECSQAASGAEGLGIELFELDHVHLSPGECLRTVVLYCELGTPAFLALHTHLFEKPGVRYVLRHHRPSQEDDQEDSGDGKAGVTVVGYGVEMHLKNMEYKNIDEKSSSEAPGQTETEPEVSEASGDAARLPEEEDEDEDLEKAEQAIRMSRLGQQAVYKVLHSPQPMSALVDLAQNLPKRAISLSKIQTNTKQFRSMINDIYREVGGLGLHEGESALYINHRSVDLAVASPFSLFETVNSEGKLISDLYSVLQSTPLGVEVKTSKLIRKLLSTPMSTSSQTVNPWTGQRTSQTGADARFRFRLGEEVGLINDIEKDDRYRGWSKALVELLMPSFYGMPRSARRNVYTSIHFIDPSVKEQLFTAVVMERFMVQNAPIRMGVVLVCPEAIRQVQRMRRADDLDILEADPALATQVFETLGRGPSGSSCEAVLEPAYSHNSTTAAKIIALFHHFKGERLKGFRFLINLHGRTKGDTVLDEDVQAAFDEVAGEKKLSERVLNSTEAREVVKRTTLYVVDRGMTTVPAVLFNGLLIKGKAPRESLVEGLQKEQPYIRELIQNGVLRDKIKDVHKAILDHNHAGSRYNSLVFSSAEFQLLRPAELKALPFLTPQPQAKASLSEITHVLALDMYSRSGLNVLVQILHHFHASSSAVARLGLLFHSARGVEVLPTALVAMLRATQGSPTQSSTLLQFAVLLRKVFHPGEAAPFYIDRVRAIVAAMDAAQTREAPEGEGGEGNPQGIGEVYRRKDKLRVSFRRDQFDAIFNEGQGSAECCKEMLQRHRENAAGLPTSHPTLLTNGRRLSLTEDSLFLSEDFAVLEAYEQEQRTSGVVEVLTEFGVLPPATPAEGAEAGSGSAAPAVAQRDALSDV
eukprot:RCo042061